MLSSCKAVYYRLKQNIHSHLKEESFWLVLEDLLALVKTPRNVSAVQNGSTEFGIGTLSLKNSKRNHSEDFQQKKKLS